METYSITHQISKLHHVPLLILLFPKHIDDGLPFKQPYGSNEFTTKLASLGMYAHLKDFN